MARQWAAVAVASVAYHLLFGLFVGARPTALAALGYVAAAGAAYGNEWRCGSVLFLASLLASTLEQCALVVLITLSPIARVVDTDSIASQGSVLATLLALSLVTVVLPCYIVIYAMVRALSPVDVVCEKKTE